MRRREFVRLLGGAAAAWPVVARAQPAGKRPTIGYIGGGGPITQRAWVEAFVQRLRELGWIEGRTIAIEYRWGEGSAQRYAEFAAEFVRLKVDVFSRAEPRQRSRRSRRHHSSRSSSRRREIRSAADWSLRWRDRAATSPDCRTKGAISPPKRLGLLREVFPALRRLAVMANADYSGGATEREEIDAAARALGIEVIPLPIRRVEDIASSFYELKGGVEALYTTGDPIVHAHRLRIITFALVARLPTMFTQREYVASGGLLSYGPNFLELNRRAADYVDKILRGAKPADLPVEQPTRFELAVNLITANALGLEVPPALLARADEVIE